MKIGALVIDRMNVEMKDGTWDVGLMNDIKRLCINGRTNDE